MRIFKSLLFGKWARKEKLSDKMLKQAIKEMEEGLVDACLGAYIYKKRIAVQGRGKRAGARTIIAYKTNEVAFFIFGFAKNERDNISTEELKRLKAFAETLLGYTPALLDQAVKNGRLSEVNYVG